VSVALSRRECGAGDIIHDIDLIHDITCSVSPGFRGGAVRVSVTKGDFLRVVQGAHLVSSHLFVAGTYSVNKTRGKEGFVATGPHHDSLLVCPSTAYMILTYDIDTYDIDTVSTYDIDTYDIDTVSTYDIDTYDMDTVSTYDIDTYDINTVSTYDMDTVYTLSSRFITGASAARKAASCTVA
jgi:hypothetical protein